MVIIEHPLEGEGVGDVAKTYAVVFEAVLCATAEVPFSLLKTTGGDAVSQVGFEFVHRTHKLAQKDTQRGSHVGPATSWKHIQSTSLAMYGRERSSCHSAPDVLFCSCSSVSREVLSLLLGGSDRDASSLPLRR